MILLEGLHHISLGSSDLKRSLEFYREVLGFELEEETETYLLLNLDPVSLRLNLMEGYRNKIKNPAEVSLSFVLDVDDFTDAIVELESKGIEVIEGPVVIEGGESLLISDPDGNLIEFFYNEQ